MCGHSRTLTLHSIERTLDEVMFIRCDEVIHHKPNMTLSNSPQTFNEFVLLRKNDTELYALNVFKNVKYS